MKSSNGNRYVIDNDGLNKDLGRDLDVLLTKFKNLRWSLYHRYSRNLSNEAEREELKEYIDEQFIKLVKEYDIHSNVDFPGYIKTKLTLRVQNSYIKKNEKYKSNELLGTQDNTVEMMAEAMNSSFENSELVSFIFDDVQFTELQSELLKELVNVDNQADESIIISQVAVTMNTKRADVAKELTELRDYIKYKLNAYYENGKNTTNSGNSGKVYTDNYIWN